MGKSMLAVIAAMAMAAAPVAGQQQGEKEVEVKAGQTRIQVDPAERRAETAEQRAQTPEQRAQGQAGQRQGGGIALRASDFEGLEVRNMQDEELGEVEDVVIDLQTGRVRYVAMSVGGVLGVGGKMFAVPWGAFRYRMADNEQYLVLNATSAQFENAPGFDENQWPNFADRQWRMTNDRFYGEQGFIEREGTRVRDGENQRRRRVQPENSVPETDN